MTLKSFALLALAALSLTACKDGLVEPERFGSIEGAVVDFDTGAAIPSAGITTSPATDAITADGEGRFSVPNVLTGTYVISASRSGYRTSTVTVSVREGRTAQATLFMTAVEEGEESMLTAEVLGFTNEAVSADTSFVTVEYRAQNTGGETIATYEVYFRIDTNQGPYYQEVNGEDLTPGEQDVSTFRKAILGAVASGVVLEGSSTETVTPGT